MGDTNIHGANGNFRPTYYQAGANGVSVDVAGGKIQSNGGATWSSSAPGLTSGPFEQVAVNPYPWRTGPTPAELLAELKARGGLSGLMPGELPVGTYEATLRQISSPHAPQKLRIEVTAPGEARLDLGRQRDNFGRYVPVTIVMKGAEYHAQWDDQGRSFATWYAQMAPQYERRGQNLLVNEYKPTHFLNLTPERDRMGTLSLQGTMGGPEGVTDSGHFTPVRV